VVFNENEKIRVLNDKKTFEDKMKPKYSYEKYTVKKIKNNVLDVVDEYGKNHTFKKYRVIKISDDTENYKKPDAIKKAVRENKIIRLLKKEDLIDEPKESRTRKNPTKKRYDDYI
jgi:ribosomal protein S21